MGKGGKKQHGGKTKPGGKSPLGADAPIRRLPVVAFEDFAEADRVFQEALSAGEFLSPEADDIGEVHEPGAVGSRARRRRPAADLIVVDLHGLTLGGATAVVDLRIAAALGNAPAGIVSFRFITGKGLHSGPGGSVLPEEIHRHVRLKYALSIVRIDASPAETALGGVPIKGHFDVSFRRGSR